MKIVELKISEIKEYSKNPRKNEQAVSAVVKSIKEFGWKQPLVIDPKTMEIVVGHTRLKAAKQLGLESVPCIMADDLTPKQIKAYRLADNKTNELAEWDFELLDEELADLLDFDMTDFGFDIYEEAMEHDVQEDDFDLDTALESIEEPVTKPGEVWQLGRHRLMCGDATKAEDLQKLMDGKLADLVLTDPPYNVNYEGKTNEKLKIENDKQSDKDFTDFVKVSLQNIYTCLRGGGVFYLWHADSKGQVFRQACEDTALKVRQCLVWAKNAFVLGRQDYQWQHEPCLYGWKDGAAHYWGSDRKQTTLLNFDRPQRNDMHPTMKPVLLFDYLIQNSSKEGEVVFDAFVGSGTTMIACEQNGRTCYGMELDPKYCDVIIKRWEMLTNQKAVRLSG